MTQIDKKLEEIACNKIKNCDMVKHYIILSNVEVEVFKHMQSKTWVTVRKVQHFHPLTSPHLSTTSTSPCLHCCEQHDISHFEPLF
ncbi:hypothetical protein ILYODFUR_015411 [Ilyodon furcidens]|uniref:Uncharacterized protein n=1 Tax=Ilyodon furcidens TaxID=33524 RepID=A0ABV0UGA9_9TELE